MNLKYKTILGAFSALAVGFLLSAPTRASAQEQGPEELTRGPVHEAFATSVGFNPEPGMLVKTPPPGLIEEIPPDQRPTGDNVTWIPGYWGWEEEQTDFIWISGIWRNLPPDRQWVPGYWGNVDSQWQWTSGYWADESTEEVAYLPQPPKSLESGPNIAAPSNNDTWIPGNWAHHGARYAWTPGYWEPARANWIWIPAHYQWTRYGHIFVGGYWDYAVANRGVMFAPVRFHGDSYSRPGYSYTPLMVISLNVFLNHLFVRPSYGHYYFGDYYSPRYRDDGYYGSYSYNSGRNGYDPIDAYNRWNHRNDRNWDRSRRENFEYYRDNEADRPPRTWAALQARPEAGRKGGRDDFQIAQPLASYATSREEGRRFKQVDKQGRDKLVAQNQQMREFSKKRQQIESRAGETTDKDGNVKQEKFAKSPVVAKRADQLPASEAPPKRLAAREPKGKADMPGEKPATEGKIRPDGIDRPDQERGKTMPPDAKPERKEIPRTTPKADTEKPNKPDTQPERGRDVAKPTAEPRKNPAIEEKPKAQPPVDRPQGKKADSPPKPEAAPKQPEAAPKPRQKPEPQPERQIPPQKQRPDPGTRKNPQSEPQPQAAPEKRPPPRMAPEQNTKPASEPNRQPDRKNPDVPNDETDRKKKKDQ